MLDEIFEHRGKKYRRLQNIYDSSNCGKCVFKDYNKCDEMHNHCYDDDTDVEFFFEETK